MHEFKVQFRSFHDVQEFISIASGLPYKLYVGSERFQASATSFLGMFALNCRGQLPVHTDCSQEELDQLLGKVEHFLCK